MRLTGTAAALLLVLAVGCGGTPGEFSGDGWFSAHVMVCRHHERCVPLRYPLKDGLRIEVIARWASTGGLALGAAVDPTAGKCAWYLPPGRFVATLKPRRYPGLSATRAVITMTKGTTTRFRLAYR